MSTLHERLAELAEDAPPGDRLPDLWERGRRIARRRRLGTVAIAAAACLALVVVGVLGWQRGRTTVEPASPESRPALPDRLYTPSRWLPGTAGHPIGPIAALVPGERGSHGWGFAGVSATTGEYRFLDLPDLVADSTGDAPPQLAPDGRHVAYWLAGRPSGAPWTSGDVITGVAVYDTTSGRLERHDIETVHGLSPWTLTWVDGDRLLVAVGEHQGAAGSDDASSSRLVDRPLVWDLRDRSVRRVGGQFSSVAGSTGEGEVLVQEDSGPARLLDPDDAEGSARTVALPALPYTDGLAVTPEGRLAGLWGGADGTVTSGEETVAVVNPGSGARLTPVPGLAKGIWGIEGWAGDGRLVVLRAQSGDGTVVDRVDVGTGKAERLTAYPRDFQGGRIALADGMLGGEPVARPAPPDPVDPRHLAGLAGGIALAAAAAVLVWRRRARP
jgi:hypothetical protein